MDSAAKKMYNFRANQNTHQSNSAQRKVINIRQLSQAEIYGIKGVIYQIIWKNNTYILEQKELNSNGSRTH